MVQGPGGGDTSAAVAAAASKGAAATFFIMMITTGKDFSDFLVTGQHYRPPKERCGRHSVGVLLRVWGGMLLLLRAFVWNRQL